MVPMVWRNGAAVIPSVAVSVANANRNLCASSISNVGIKTLALSVVAPGTGLTLVVDHGLVRRAQKAVAGRRALVGPMPPTGGIASRARGALVIHHPLVHTACRLGRAGCIAVVRVRVEWRNELFVTGCT